MLPFAPILFTQIDEPPKRDSYIVQLKYDGVRFIYTPDGQILSRKLNAFPAESALRQIEHFDLLHKVNKSVYWEGEIFSMTKPCAEVSGFAQRKNPGNLWPDLQIKVFDFFDPARTHLTYSERLELIPDFLRPDESEDVPSYCDGLIYRDPDLRYYRGRSPFDYKLKVFNEIDCTIVGVTPRYENANAPDVDNLGYVKRSSHQIGLIETEFVGMFNVMAPNGVVFSLGSGIPRDWLMADAWLDKTAVVRYNGTYPDGTPRFPRLIEVR